MRLVSCLVFVIAVNSALAQGPPSIGRMVEGPELMPKPKKMELQQGRLPVREQLTAGIEGPCDDRVRSGAERFLQRLGGRTGYILPRTATAGGGGAIVIRCEASGNSVPALGDDESYDLEVSPSRATLISKTSVGALRGLETILQLLSADRDGFFLPAIQVDDAPEFLWRGLMIDVGRHYQPMHVLKRNIDGMAAVKLNVLHWHLTEDQGFRIESKKYPKLHQMGSDGHFYTQEEAREIIVYARERGIRVVPEFDMPGHVQTWLVGHPELAAAPGPHEISRKWGIMDAALDPTKDEVYKLVDGFLGEMAKLFPDAYMHIGGDENNGKWWDANPNIQEFKQKRGIKDNLALQTYFNQRLQKILKKHGKRMMGWDEILQPDLPKDVVVHSWRGREALAEAAKQGYDGVLSAPYYIDLMKPASDHYVDIVSADTALQPEQRRHILGGEATMWSEWVSPDTLDSRIWPRTAAIAEKFWSGPAANDVNDMYRRLPAVGRQLEELGLTHFRNRAVLLRNIARTSEIGPLETLIGYAGPVKVYRRGELQGVSSLTPLVRWIDASNVDSPEAREFMLRVEDLLSDVPRFTQNQDDIKVTLAGWRDIRAPFIALMQDAPLLKEVEPLANELAELGNIGLESLAYLATGSAPAGGWRESKLAFLDSAAKPKAYVEFSVLPAMRELVIAAAELQALKTMPPSEWRKRVKALAAPPAAPPQPAH